MTFIQPHKNTGMHSLILGCLVILLLMGTGSLVMLYNRVVDLNHDIAGVKAELDSVGAESTALSNQAMAAEGSDQGASFAAAQGLVMDGNPQYFSEPTPQDVAEK